jgi:hypothetical protein
VVEDINVGQLSFSKRDYCHLGSTEIASRSRHHLPIVRIRPLLLINGGANQSCPLQLVLFNFS